MFYKKVFLKISQNSLDTGNTCVKGSFLTLFRIGLFGLPKNVRSQKAPPLPPLRPFLKSVNITFTDETWHSFTLAKKIQKICKLHDITLEFCILLTAFFHRKSAYFAVSRNTDIAGILIYNF